MNIQQIVVIGIHQNSVSSYSGELSLIY